MLFPKHPMVAPAGGRVVHRAWQEEGEGQYKIHKTKDWVEEDFSCLSERMGWATKLGFKGSAFVALIDILLVKQITERKAQLARFAYFTIPLTTMAAGWMGGIELGKIALGRDSQEAWLAGSIVPGGIMGIWTRNVYGGMRTSLFLGAVGYMYQWSTNNNLTNTITPNYDNPNMPYGRFNYNQAFFWPTKGEHGTDIHEKIGLYPKDPGPSWKKWEDKEES